MAFQAGALRSVFEWRFRSLKITVTLRHVLEVLRKLNLSQLINMEDYLSFVNCLSALWPGYMHNCVVYDLPITIKLRHFVNKKPIRRKVLRNISTKYLFCI